MIDFLIERWTFAANAVSDFVCLVKEWNLVCGRYVPVLEPRYYLLSRHTLGFLGALQGVLQGALQEVGLEGLSLCFSFRA